jgi:hypothetical protein
MFQPAELFRNEASEAAAIQSMCAAYELVSKSLADDEDRRPEVVNQVIARRVMRAARSGERDPAALAQKVLNAFGLAKIGF